MSAVFDLLQKLYYIRESSKLNRIMEQLDAISRLLLKLFGCEFVAVYYSKEEQGTLIPVAYHGWDNQAIKGLPELEKRWTLNSAASQKVQRGFSHFDHAISDTGEEDLFADANQFAARFQYPIFVGNYLRGVVVAYWKVKPEADQKSISHILNPLAEILIGWMALIEEMQSIGNFSLRLSTLISMFEIPLNEHRTNELLSELLRAASSIAPRSSVGIVSRDAVTGKYELTECIAPETPAPDFVSLINSHTAALMEKIRFDDGSTKGWYDLSGFFDDFGRSVIAMELHKDDRHHWAVVFWTPTEPGFSENDLELVSVYKMFAKTIITNALLVRDLSKANDKIRESSDKLTEMETLAALADMSSGIAHDFNNIIGAMVGRLQLMKMKTEDEKTKEQLSKLENLALEGSHTIKRIQQFSHCVRPKEITTVDLLTTLKTYFDAKQHGWTQLAEQKSVVVDLKSDTIDGLVAGVEDDVIVVVDRLVQNAVEYAPIHSNVRVIITAGEKQITISVSDSGPGIPVGIQKKIFYPFFTTKSERGAGLGLAIVYGIVGRLGGKVTFECHEGTGTVFQVSLNRAVGSAMREPSDVSHKPRKMEKLRVLVVDDDDQIREVLSDMLSMDGHVTTACPDGYAAIKSLEAEPFDVMITDLGMPGMSGLDLAGFAHEQFPKMPIAMITGWGMQLNQDEIAMKGIRAVLPKPFHMKDVKALVQDLAAKAKAAG
jgi:signal transduction histidine kinase/CheY-like chemotaxis protein